MNKAGATMAVPAATTATNGSPSSHVMRIASGKVVDTALPRRRIVMISDRLAASLSTAPVRG